MLNNFIKKNFKKNSQKKFQNHTPKKFEKTIWRCIVSIFLNLREVLTINLTIGDSSIFFSNRNGHKSIVLSTLNEMEIAIGLSMY